MSQNSKQLITRFCTPISFLRCQLCYFLLTCDLFDFPVALGLLLCRPELLLPHEERHPHRPEAAAAALQVVGRVELGQLHVLHDPLVQGIESDKEGVG